MLLRHHSLDTRWRNGWTWWRAPVAVDRLEVRRYGARVLVRAVCTGLSAPQRTLYWFVDGEFRRRTAGLQLALVTPDPVALDVYASPLRDLDMSKLDHRPLRAARRTLHWVRPDGAVDTYRCEWVTGESGGTWATFATVADTGAWSYRVRTPRLADLTYYRFRVTPVYHGNDGVTTTWAATQIVRIPDAPTVAATFNAVTQKVTFTA